MKSVSYNLQLLNKPAPFQMGTLTLWSDEYIARNVLKKHLDENVDSGSRKQITIIKTVEWIRKKYPNAKEILDVGCGPGIYGPLFCRSGFQYQGFDISSYQISYAKRHNLIKGKTDYYVCDFRTWEFKKTYDIVLLLYGIYSFYSYDERISFLKKIRHGLNDGGCVIIEIFTEKHYEGRKDSTDWEVINERGFWRCNPYLELNAFRRYEEKLMLVQAAVIDQSIEIWNSWIQAFDSYSIMKELREAGFKDYELYASCFGKTYENESEVICVCAY